MLLELSVRPLVEQERPVAGERELVVEDVEQLRVERVRDVGHDHDPTVRVLRVIRLRAARFGV